MKTIATLSIYSLALSQLYRSPDLPMKTSSVPTPLSNTSFTWRKEWPTFFISLSPAVTVCQ